MKTVTCDRCGAVIVAENLGADIVVHLPTEFNPQMYCVCEQCLTTLKEVFQDGVIV